MKKVLKRPISELPVSELACFRTGLSWNWPVLNWPVLNWPVSELACFGTGLFRNWPVLNWPVLNWPGQLTGLFFPGQNFRPVYRPQASLIGFGLGTGLQMNSPYMSKWQLLDDNFYGVVVFLSNFAGLIGKQHAFNNFIIISSNQ